MTRRLPIDRLILLYDADSGRWGRLRAIATHALARKGCALASITHDLFGVKPEWRDHRVGLGVAVTCLTRDRIPPRLRAAVGDRIPAVIAEVMDQYVVVLDRDVLRRSRGNVLDFAIRLEVYASLKGLLLPPSRVSRPASS
jgi:hypothetical protein